MSYHTPFESIVLLGKIASGKGTQATAILDHFGGVLYSNGNNVRKAATETSVFGKKMKAMYEGGYLIPEWIACYWMTHALVSQFEKERVVFEAVAKKPNEAELFHDIHQWLGRRYVVFHLEISDDEVRRRSEARARDIVDSPKSVEKRLEEYRTYTAHSIEIFRRHGTLIDVDGAATPEVVRGHIFAYLTNTA